MSQRQKLTLEFLVGSSPNILYNYISTPSGLQEWFADKVNVKGKIYKFIWEGEETPAEVVRKVQGKTVRFKFIDSAEEEYLELEIRKDELTGDIALVVTDWCDEEESEEIQMLWDSQVQTLRSVLGV